MGMPYLPVYEGEDESGIVTVNPQRVQMLGVKTAPVELRTSLASKRFAPRRSPNPHLLHAIWLRKSSPSRAILKSVLGNKAGAQTDFRCSIHT
jgi:hypothetical protein